MDKKNKRAYLLMQKLGIIFCLFWWINSVFAKPVYEPSIDIKAFPNNDINYFFVNNKAESWRLVYGKITKPPPVDQRYENRCNSDEVWSDEALSFDISEIIKNTGDYFNTNNIHSYYDGDSGRKALALLLADKKLKKSIFSITKALVGRGDSEYTTLTPAKLKKKLTLLNDKEKNIMYVCYGHLQQLIATPMLGNIESSADLEIDPRKIVFWYDGAKVSK